MVEFGCGQEQLETWQIWKDEIFWSLVWLILLEQSMIEKILGLMVYSCVM